MLSRYRIIDGKVIPSDDPAAEVAVYINPGEDERKYLVNELKLDEHTLNSSLDPDEVPRLEFEPEHIALIYKRPRNYSAEEMFQFKTASVGAFLFKDRLVLVLSEDVPLFDGKVFLRVNSLAELLLKVIYRSVMHFVEHLKVMNAVSESVEHKINTSLENRYLLNLFTLEKSLVYYLSAIHSNTVLLERLKHNCVKLNLSPDGIEFLDDILIENSQCYRQAEIYSNILASLMDARASIVSNNLNVLMKTLTIITLMVMVPTFVVSVFSMNVPMPFTAGEHPLAFWGVGIMAALSGMLVYLVFRRRPFR